MVTCLHHRHAALMTLIVIGYSLFALTGKAQTVHAILVADTNDPMLDAVCKRDIEVMHHQFVQLAAAINYQLSEQIISGQEFSSKRLDSVIRNVSPKPNDILFLYYTGHGYNTSQRAGRFPVLLLEKDERISQQNPALAAIHQVLKSKRARLCITMGDCCNHLVKNMRGMLKKTVVQKARLPIDSVNAMYRKLFLNVTGDVLIASSRPPQQSCAHPDSGSFYTRSFNEALELACLYTKTITWETLLRDAQNRLTRHQATHTKQSIYEVNMTSVPDKHAIRDTIQQKNSLGLTALNVTLRTDRGRTSVEYWEGNQLIFEAKANKPCHLRLVYLLADGTKILLENDFENKPGQENQYVRIAPEAAFVCAAPFGVENLLAYAAEDSFCPLPTLPNPTFYVRNESGYTILVGSLAETMEAVHCTKNRAEVAEDRIQITTRGLP